MTSSLHIDPALFDPAAIPAETLALNKDVVARLDAEPVELSIPQIRARRIQGFGAFPPSPKSPRAETITIDGPFAAGSKFVMNPDSDEAVQMTLAEVVPGTSFTDLAEFNGLVIRTIHLMEPAEGGDLKITYVRTLDEVLEHALEKEPVAPAIVPPEPKGKRVEVPRAIH